MAAHSDPARRRTRRHRSSGSAAAVLAAAMTERQLQDGIIDAATQRGWLCYHTHQSVNSEAGFPDLVMVRSGRLLVWELKKQGESPTVAQQRWLDEFAGCAGLDVRVVRPADYDDALAALV